MVWAGRQEMMKPKYILLLLAGLGVGLTTPARAKDDLPKTENFARYQAMLKRSPFAVATAGAPLPSSPDFAKDLFIANAAHSTDGDFVTLASTVDKNLKEYLNTKETINGFSISNIQWSDQVGETKVTIAKDGKFATLTFNEALLSQAIQNPVPAIPQPQAQQPGNPARPLGNPPGQLQRPMPIPQIPTPAPHVRPIIRRKSVPQPPVQQPQNQVQSQSDDDTDFENP
ncbi:MAG: hypothetical protein ABI540_07765 [Spartobacteria bacterium]